jgi:hypothetical protein
MLSIDKMLLKCKMEKWECESVDWIQVAQERVHSNTEFINQLRNYQLLKVLNHVIRH